MEKPEVLDKIRGERPSTANAGIDSVGFMRGLKPTPLSGLSLFAACEAPANRLLFLQHGGRLFVTEDGALKLAEGCRFAGRKLHLAYDEFPLIV